MEFDRTDVALLETALFGQAASSKQTLLEGDSPKKTVELAVNAARFASDMILKVLDGTGTKTACCHGCSYCCHVSVGATVPEVLTIAEYVRERFTEEERDRLMQAIDANIQATEGMTREQRMDYRTPCPLLKDGSCTVYEIRPMTCRAWHSADADRCREDFEEPKNRRGVPTNGLALQMGANVINGLCCALKSQRLDDHSLDLVRALKIALEDPSLIEMWRSRPRAFSGAARESVHPDPPYYQSVARQDREVYRWVTNRPEWNEIEPGRRGEG
jgi:Fe-S-cluster containining protein